jgi:GNAT superfamily N-acetyltransferase
MVVTIRPLQPTDEAVWHELWQGYLDFYQTEVPPAVTATTWERLVGTTPHYLGFVAEQDGEVVGMATVVVHDYTWSDKPAGLLHDLYVRPEVRGGGVGRALIDHVVAQGRADGWARVYWMTKEDNAPARRLYDSYAPADGFVRYRVAL